MKVIVLGAGIMEGFASFCLSLLFIQTAVSQDINEKIATIAYTRTTTKVICPGQISFILPRWTGPPVTSSGALTIYTLDGLEMINPATPRISYAADNRSILVNNTELEDAGRYICFKKQFAFNGENEVTVRTSPNTPDITASETAGNGSVQGTEGQTLTVTCTSRGGNPVPTVVWYKGNITGQILAQTSTGIQKDGSYTLTLNYTFTPLRQDDGQQLVCRSYYPTPVDSQGSKETSVTLHLFLNPSKPVVSQSASVAAGNEFSVECRTNDSRPAANISWTYQGQTYTPAVTVKEDPSTLTYTTVSVLQRPATAADHGQIVQCAVTHGALTGALTESITLNVLYPPVVTVYITNATVTNTSTTMTCSPSGNPERYSFSEWIHSWDGQVVSRLPNTSVLTLTGLTYEHSGVYICRATNNIGGYQHGSGMLLVKSFPIILQPQSSVYEVVVAVGDTALINVTFFSNTDHISATCTRIRDHQDIDTIMLENNEIFLPVFDHIIHTKGMKAVVSIAVTSEADFGEYQIIISNEIGNAEMVVNVTDGRPPSVPEEFDAQVLSFHSVNVSWSAGYHGGLDQTFVTQISTNQRSWIDISVYGGKETHGRLMFHVIDRLSADTLYYVRIYAQNAKGRSNFSPVKQLTADIQPVCECASTSGQTNPSALIGTAIGGVFGGILLSVVLLQIITRLTGRRITKYKDSNQSSKKARGDCQLELRVQNSDTTGEGPANTYEKPIGEEQSAHIYSDLKSTKQGSANTYETLSGEEQSAHTYSDIKPTTQERSSIPSGNAEYTNLPRT